MLIEYQGKQYHITDIAWENFKKNYPQRCEHIRTVKEYPLYISYTELMNLTDPPLSELKEYIIKEWIRLEDKYLEAVEETNLEKMDKYNYQLEILQKIGIDLIFFDPNIPKNQKIINEYLRKQK